MVMTMMIVRFMLMTMMMKIILEMKMMTMMMMMEMMFFSQYQHAVQLYLRPVDTNQTNENTTKEQLRKKGFFHINDESPI